MPGVLGWAGVGDGGWCWRGLWGLVVLRDLGGGRG